MSVSRALSLIDDTLLYINKLPTHTSSIKQSHTSLDDEKKINIEPSKSSIYWTGKRIRKTFIDYFTTKQKHTFIHSSPVVPIDDPTLLFTNAGMNQFKPIFLGQISKNDQFSNLKRVVNSQKCIRAGGKHNDLDDVGRDTYHHTFFEMLGNWSFGDFFKKEAIEYAWDLLINVYKLNPDRIYATYFQGNNDVPCDNEAKNIWLKYLPKDRVLPFDAKDNFWEMGDTGPCGPCTEIHYDRIGNRDASNLVNMDDPTVIEIWNLVFIQYNRKPDKSLESLPNKHVDTGMGFERLASILQNKFSNYDTDIFEGILKGIQKETNIDREYKGLLGKNDVGEIDMAYRVLADHARTLTFSIADGAQPGSQNRNYVVRSILRRGIRYGKMKLGAKCGFFKNLVDYVVNDFSDFFPEIKKKQKFIKSIIYEEEKIFDKTLEKGEKLFKKKTDELLKNNIKKINGEIIFDLYRTYGFPPDLSNIMAEEIGMSIDMKEYESEMEKHRERSRNINEEDKYLIYFGDKEKTYLNNKTSETDDSYKYIWKDIKCKCVGIYNKNTSSFVDKIDKKSCDVAVLIFDKTNYYAESGGQVGDIGYINSNDDEFEVKDVQEFAGYILHIGEVTQGQITLNTEYTTQLDYNNRKNIAPNHTMTHVLNYALREVIGPDCHQKGSLVDSDKTRFDFSYNKALKLDEIIKIENIVNNIIKQSLPIYTEIMKYDDIKKVKALRAMFGERYPTNVRVVSIGCKPSDALKTPNNDKWFNYSIELCGGTHLSNTKDAKQFIIISEDANTAGVRRLVAVTGTGAYKATLEYEELEKDLKESLSLKDAPLLISQCSKMNDKFDHCKISYIKKSQLKSLLKELNTKVIKYKSKISKLLTKNIKQLITQYINQKLNNNNNNIPNYCIIKCDCDNDPKSLKEGIKLWTKNKKSKDIPVILYTYIDDINEKNKIVLMSNLSKNNKLKGNNGYNAKEWLKSVEKLIDGGGGGNEFKGQFIGKSVERIDEVVKVLDEYGKKYFC